MFCKHMFSNGSSYNALKKTIVSFLFQYQDLTLSLFSNFTLLEFHSTTVNFSAEGEGAALCTDVKNSVHSGNKRRHMH